MNPDQAQTYLDNNYGSCREAEQALYVLIEDLQRRAAMLERAPTKLTDLAPELLAQLKLAVQACRCSVRERDSGHLVDCFVPGALDVIARAEGAQR